MAQANEIGRAVAAFRASLESPSTSLHDASSWNEGWDLWRSEAAGVSVNIETALGVPAVWAAVNFIASTIATLPLHLYDRKADGRLLADKAPLYAILHDAVNPELSSFAWRRMAMQSILLHGRSYSFIERNVSGRIINLWPLDPLRVRVERRNGRKLYVFQESGVTRIYQAAEVIDMPWMLAADGLSHSRPLQLLRNAIGLAIAMEGYAAKLFQNGGVPPLQLVGPMQSPGAIERAATDIMAALQAARRDGRPILPMPLMHELKTIGFDPEKGQLTDGRRFQLEEIARIYQLPPIFLQDLTHGTLSNTEQQDLHFVKHTLSQWIRAWEQELNLKLFGPRNRARFVEFNVDGLLRGDFRTRMDGYATAIQNAINTPDEIRGLENWPAMGGDACELHIQGATVPLGQQKQAGTAPPPSNNDPQGERS